MKTHSFYVENLKCGGCANTIRKTISKFSSVQNVTVDPDQSRIDLEMDNSDNQIIQIKQKLTKIGYPERGEENNMLTGAKSYVSCAIGKMGI
jgi:copper chaperone CopZ